MRLRRQKPLPLRSEGVPGFFVLAFLESVSARWRRVWLPALPVPDSSPREGGMMTQDFEALPNRHRPHRSLPPTSRGPNVVLSTVRGPPRCCSAGVYVLAQVEATAAIPLGSELVRIRRSSPIPEYCCPYLHTPSTWAGLRAFKMVSQGDGHPRA